MPESLPIRSITTYVMRVPRNFGDAIGGAGTPAELNSGTARYSRAASYGTIYSQSLEAFLVRIEAGDFVGWGEAQAPIAPEVCQAIFEHVLAPLLLGQNADDPAAVYRMLYESMRVRGHWNGFFPDALAAVDIALWDIVGQARSLPIHAMLSADAHPNIPTYVSGVVGRSIEEQVAFAGEKSSKGAEAFKVFWPGSFDGGYTLLHALRSELPAATELFVDVLWRLDMNQALFYAALFADLNIGWFEAPLPPENLTLHAELAAASPVAIAIGECYRSLADFTQIATLPAASVLQPDLGRCGITLTAQVADLCCQQGLRFAPHVSIGMGPQIAAAMHVSAATSSLLRMEVNPQILSIAQQFLRHPLKFDAAIAHAPVAPGLGIEVDQEKVDQYTTRSTTHTRES